MNEPTEPGWYWWKCRETAVWEVVKVGGEGGILWISRCEHDVCLRVSHAGGRWGGRVTFPEDRER